MALPFLVIFAVESDKGGTVFVLGKALLVVCVDFEAADGASVASPERMQLSVRVQITFLLQNSTRFLGWSPFCLALENRVWRSNGQTESVMCPGVDIC